MDLHQQSEQEPSGGPAAQKESSGKATHKSGIPDRVRAKMEKAMNADFSKVRVHAASSKPANFKAEAYTQGENIHFKPGQYNPDTAQGQQLLGHELAHVVQQREGKVPVNGTELGQAVNTDEHLEKEADVLGTKAANHKL